MLFRNDITNLPNWAKGTNGTAVRVYLVPYVPYVPEIFRNLGKLTAYSPNGTMQEAQRSIAIVSKASIFLRSFQPYEEFRIQRRISR